MIDVLSFPASTKRDIQRQLHHFVIHTSLSTTLATSRYHSDKFQFCRRLKTQLISWLCFLAHPVVTVPTAATLANLNWQSTASFGINGTQCKLTRAQIRRSHDVTPFGGSMERSGIKLIKFKKISIPRSTYTSTAIHVVRWLGTFCIVMRSSRQPTSSSSDDIFTLTRCICWHNVHDAHE